MTPLRTTERSRAMATAPNPESRLDYVVKLEGHVPPSRGVGRLLVSVRYVPDRDILKAAAFGEYLDALAAISWDSVEQIAAAILEDVNNETVARWVQVIVTAPDNHYPGIDSHGVLLEDRQPKWDNPAILSRLRRY